ncbi:hypothetical protein M9458_054972 [Cirrhinus mrigala]|uniref:Uncharacterized protein n=1 Tax=Cirrhinus mrigala TaxID=683832 RepID=A0ABD0MIM8_CIRMR
MMGSTSFSGFIHSLAAALPQAAISMRLTSGPRVRQLIHPIGSACPFTHPSWTHEDTSVHARGRDRSPEERRARHFNSGGDEASLTSATSPSSGRRPRRSATFLNQTQRSEWAGIPLRVTPSRNATGPGTEKPEFSRQPQPTAAISMRFTSGPRVRQLVHPIGGARPFTHPSWTHEDTSVHARGRDWSPEERRARHFNSGGDEASFTSSVPHHTPPDLAVFQRPSSSHTPTPVGSLVKGGDYRRGEADN